MKIAFYDTHRFEKDIFEGLNENFGFDIQFYEARLDHHTAKLARGMDAVCCFVNDTLDRKTMKVLEHLGIKMIALRCAGFNNVDLTAAAKAGIMVTRVPEYSPHAVAEHALALILSLNRKTHKAYHRVRDLNFNLEGLVGFDLAGKNVGILGTGKIGSVFAKIMSGIGCNIYAFDKDIKPRLEKNYGVRYVSLRKLFKESDIISLHLPLTPETKHIIDERALNKMKKGVMLINTGRGALIDSNALIGVLKSGHLGYAGLDVYEEEENVFFRDLSEKVLQDDCLARLLTFPNVLITSHQGFLTQEALRNIAATTLTNIQQFEREIPLTNSIAESDTRDHSNP